MSTPPPGWYPDPNGGRSRWWDGQQWHDAPPAPPSPQHQEPPAQQWRPGAPIQPTIPPTGAPAGMAAPLAPVEVPTGRGWVVPVVALGALAVIIGVYVVAGSTSGRLDAEDARAVVVQLTDAMYQGDCRGVQEATSQQYWNDGGLTCADVAEVGDAMQASDVTFDVGEAEVDGEQASVRVEIGEPQSDSDVFAETVTFEVRRSGDVWLVTADDS